VPIQDPGERGHGTEGHTSGVERVWQRASPKRRELNEKQERVTPAEDEKPAPKIRIKKLPKKSSGGLHRRNTRG